MNKSQIKAIRAQERALLRSAFLRRLTVDSETKDMRRKEFNQAIFDAENGKACWIGTDLDMVMDAFDAACRDLGRL